MPTTKRKIIVMIDCNEDIRTGKMNQMLTHLGLKSPVRQKHGTCNIPNTYHRGSAPIDDIYMSDEISFVRCGYLAFGDGPGDHRGIYIDINKKSLIGNSLHSIHRQQARRLISSNKRVADKFNKLFEQQLNRNHVMERMHQLDNHCQDSITPEQIYDFDKLDRLYVQSYLYANKRCHRLRAGEVAFVPDDIQDEGLKIRFWTLCIHKKCGCDVSSKFISRCSNCLKIKRPMQIGIDDMKLKGDMLGQNMKS